MTKNWKDTDLFNLPPDEEALEQARQKKMQDGQRPANVSHHLDGVAEIKVGKTKREYLLCSQCKQPFLVDVNGDRAVFEDQNKRIIIVEFSEILGLCNKCSKATFLPSVKAHRSGTKKLQDEYNKLSDSDINNAKDKLLNWDA